MADKSKGAGIPVRAVSRALAVLQFINRKGNPTIMEIKEATGLPYPTVFRMVSTLAHEGMIEADAQKRYRPTELVWSLVVGFQDDEKLVEIAKPYLTKLTEDLLWPVSISVRVGSRMMVKHSTSSMTTQTFTNYYPGYTLPLLECAAGKAYLAYCSAEELDVIRKTMGEFAEHDAGWGAELARNDFFLEQIRSDGYAQHARNQYNETPGRTSAISVPVLVDGVAHSTLTVIFFEKAMSMEDAAKHLVPALKASAESISEKIRQKAD